MRRGLGEVGCVGVCGGVVLSILWVEVRIVVSRGIFNEDGKVC